MNTTECKIIYDQIQTTLTTMKPESNITFDDFLQKLGITEVYISALQSSICHAAARQPPFLLTT